MSTSKYPEVNILNKNESVPVITIKEANISKNCLFTIAIPTYKRIDLLPYAINSALNQEGEVPYTIIIVDNNPEREDETEQFMSEYSNHPMISYYKNNENIGMTGNWNRLYQLAKTKYVVMLHDDDLLYPDYLEKIHKTIIETEAKYAAYFVTPTYWDMNTTDFSQLIRITKKIRIRKIPLKKFIEGNIVGNPTTCIDRDCLISVGMFSLESYPSIDYDMYVKLARQYQICQLENYPLSIYRISKNVSCKTETIISVALADLEIKREIISNKGYLLRTIWDSYVRVSIYRNTDNLKRMFHNASFDTNIELRKININYNKIDYLIYTIINLQFRIKSKLCKYYKRVFR